MSKYSIINGEEITKCFIHFGMKETRTEGNLLAVNQKFIAAQWEGGAYTGIAIFDKFHPIDVPPQIPIIRAHNNANINDLKWDPFIPNLLASASDDGTVKFWQIPKDGIRQDIEKEKGIYKDHGKRVLFLQFHPSSADIVASADSTNKINVWNLQGKTYISMPAKNTVSSLEWNYNGSLIGCMLKDKYSYLYDIRGQKEVCKSKGFNSLTTQKMCFVSDDCFIISGTENGKRQINLYDMRKPDSSVSNIVLDNFSSVMRPFYDYDINCIFVPSTDRDIHFVTIKGGKLAFLHGRYDFKEDNTYYTFEDKRYVDLNMNEMTRMYRYNKKTLRMTSIKIPRKTNVFDPELYPDTFSGESALTVDEWMSGVDKEPIKRSIKDIGTLDITKKNTITEEKDPYEGIPLEQQLKMLQDENEEIKKNISKEQDIEEKLRKEIEELNEQLK